MPTVADHIAYNINIGNINIGKTSWGPKDIIYSFRYNTWSRQWMYKTTCNDGWMDVSGRENFLKKL